MRGEIAEFLRKGCKERSEEVMNAMLELTNIHKTFNKGTINEKPALRGVDLTLRIRILSQ